MAKFGYSKYLQSLFVSLVLQQKLQQNIRLVWPCRGYYRGCCLTKIQDLTKFASCTLLYVVSQILYPAGSCTCSQGKYYLITIIDNIIPRAWSGYEVMIATFKQTQRTGQEREQNTLPSIRGGERCMSFWTFLWINPAKREIWKDTSSSFYMQVHI